MKLTIDGIQLHFNLGRGGLGWSSDWAKVHRLCVDGFLRAEYGGPATYGACGYFLTPKGETAGIPWTEGDESRYS